MKQFFSRYETEVQKSHQKMSEQTTIENTRFVVNAQGLAQKMQSTFFGRPAPGVNSVVRGKKGKGFSQNQTKGFEKTFVVPLAQTKRDFLQNDIAEKITFRSETFSGMDWRNRRAYLRVAHVEEMEEVEEVEEEEEEEDLFDLLREMVVPKFLKVSAELRLGEGKRLVTEGERP